MILKGKQMTKQGLCKPQRTQVEGFHHHFLKTWEETQNIYSAILTFFFCFSPVLVTEHGVLNILGENSVSKSYHPYLHLCLNTQLCGTKCVCSIVHPSPAHIARALFLLQI